MRLALILLLAFPALADGPFPKQSIFCAPPLVPVCVVDPTIPPDPRLPGNNTVCMCKAPEACRVIIVYPKDNPGAAQTLPLPTWCPEPGARQAIAEALVDMLRK